MFLDVSDRNIIPRWRSFDTTLALGELGEGGARATPELNLEFLAQRSEEFRRNPSPWVAADLLSVAYVLGKPEAAAPAAKFILEKGGDLPRSSVVLAQHVLSNPPQDPQVPILAEETQGEIRKRIWSLKVRLRDQPRNGIQWVELSRLYTITGQLEKAEWAMRIACALSPSNRFVLRAAACLFSHIRNPEAALRILRKAESIRSDPWLLAAELGVARVGDVSPQFTKTGVALIERLGSENPSITELASSIASLEMHEGNSKKAKRYFRESLKHPTENSVAQAEWASRKLGGLDVDVTSFNVQRPFEALALEASINGKWEDAIDMSKGWSMDQPFSSRPAGFASFISSGLLERYADSITIIEKGLEANPKDPTLRNNLAFAYGSLGDVGNAELALSNIDNSQLTSSNQVTLSATKGLLLFRKGQADAGRKLYMEAIDLAKKHGLLTFSAMASAYLAREEIIAHTEDASSALKKAIREADGHEGKDVRRILDLVVNLAVKEKVHG